MTGYAHRTEETSVGRVTIELRSVNSRFTDLQFRLSDEVRSLEPMLRDAITNAVSRGKIECRMHLRGREVEPTGIRINDILVASLAEADANIRAIAPAAAPMTVGDYLRWHGVTGNGADAIEAGDVAGSATTLWGELQPSVSLALQDFVASRAREGEKLAATIARQIDAMAGVVAGLKPLVPELLAQAQARLTVRLQDAMAEVQSPIPSEETFARIRQEIALLNLRGDVTEELDRLAIHFNEVHAALGRGGAVGKRLDFLTQELNRESNTIASKANGIAVTDGAVALKLLIEQMREQVQNLE